MVKKWIASAMSLAMLFSLVSCGSEKAAEASAEGSLVAESSIEEPSQEIVAESPADALPGLRNPLTGEETDTDISNLRPIAVMLNALEDSLPQSGNSQADILYEMTEEGGITRVMALYQDGSQVGNLGSIRSTREYWVHLAYGMDAILVHAGGSSYGLNAIKDYGLTDVDALTMGGPFWRDEARLKYLAYEHTLFTSGVNIYNYMDSNKYQVTHDDDFVNYFTFVEDGTPVDGKTANSISVDFSNYKNTSFKYDESTGLYDVTFFGSPYLDESTDTQVSVKNVVVLNADQHAKPNNNEGRQEYTLDAGTGYYACNGVYTEIDWVKGSPSDNLQLLNKDGSPLKMGIGKTYISIIALDRTPAID